MLSINTTLHYQFTNKAIACVRCLAEGVLRCDTCARVSDSQSCCHMSHWSHHCPHHTLASLILLTLLVLPGLSRHPVHHLHHGVERADTWDDVWLIHLTPDTQPQVTRSTVKMDSMSVRMLDS